ncbi:MAG: tRNA (guanosine(37)-N1)-methyltransferase TrmD [Lachnospiraceae bacterium]|nr:tRNA (guanosine(37)-N1)-methyltransferase TrmD [Lachnospiraceae bacterium]
MNYHVLTLFPDMIEQGLHTSILGRAMEKGLISLSTIDIRDYSMNKHNRVDDYPYGGGAGMVMAPGPVYRACEAAKAGIPEGRRARVIYLTPQGKVFNQELAKEFAKEEDLIFLCGHYEGIDERVLDMVVTDYVSIGDYVLTGGELPVMVMIDVISRLVPGVLGNETSADSESFENHLLEYPQYTRPEEFMGEKVPEVLLSGHHANIERWRRDQSLLRTMKNRPDLFEKVELDKKDRGFLERLKAEEEKAPQRDA